jgi:type II secretory pathway predicted ATPase ExeA
MLCRVLMERLPAHVETIYLATPSLARDEILHAIADELQLKLSAERTSVVLRELQEHLIALYAQGRRVVILIDEAHVMPEETLEQVRLLSNLESGRHKMLQIVLFGQPELDATLAKSTLRQLRDRVTHSFRMRPLAPPEVARYISFRMRAAGYRGPDVFAARSVARLARAAGGLTRRINILADKALLAAFTDGAHAVTGRHVRSAIADSEFAQLAPRHRTAWYAAAAVGSGILIGIALQWLWAEQPAPQPAPVIAPAQAAPAPAPAPAEVLARKPEPEPLPPPLRYLGPEQERRIDGYSTGRQELLTQRVAATREALERNPDEHYSLEFFISENPDPARMERFLNRAKDMVPLDEVFVIPMAGAGRYRLRVVYGEFTSLDDAAAAEKRLPPKYRQAFHPAPRSFAELRGQL